MFAEINTIFKDIRGGSRISGKGVHMYEEVGFVLGDFISLFLNTP